MKARTLIGLSVVMLLSARLVFAMGGEYGKGDPKQPVGNSTWPAGVTVLANRTDRTSGHWINSSDWFEYNGDARAFNAFLKDYAKVKVTHPHLVLGTLSFTSGPPVETNYDWTMSAGWGNVEVTMPLGGRIRLRDLQVPASIDFEIVGEETDEVRAFLLRQKAARAKEAENRQKAERAKAALKKKKLGGGS